MDLLPLSLQSVFCLRFVHDVFYFVGIEETRKIFPNSRISEIMRKKKKRKQHRSGILHRSFHVIPATKIAQVDPPPHSLRISSALFTKDLPWGKGGDGATRFHWRNEDEERAVPAVTGREGEVLPLSPSPVSSASRADLFRRARFQFSRTPVRRRWFVTRVLVYLRVIRWLRLEIGLAWSGFATHSTLNGSPSWHAPRNRVTLGRDYWSRRYRCGSVSLDGVGRHRRSDSRVLASETLSVGLYFSRPIGNPNRLAIKRSGNPSTVRFREA